MRSNVSSSSSTENCVRLNKWFRCLHRINHEFIEIEFKPLVDLNASRYEHNALRVWNTKVFFIINYLSIISISLGEQWAANITAKHSAWFCWVSVLTKDEANTTRLRRNCERMFFLKSQSTPNNKKQLNWPLGSKAIWKIIQTQFENEKWAKKSVLHQMVDRKSRKWTFLCAMSISQMIKTTNVCVFQFLLVGGVRRMTDMGRR